MITIPDLPPGWGLLWAKGTRVKEVLASATFKNVDMHKEQAFLVSMLRRAQIRIGSRPLAEWLHMRNMSEGTDGLPPNASREV
jgi:hypothetical protein